MTDSDRKLSFVIVTVFYFLFVVVPAGRLASQLHGDGRLFASGLRLTRLEEQISETRSRLGRIASGQDVYVSRLPLPRENVTYLVKCKHGVRDLRCGGVSLQCVSDLLICDGRLDCFNGFDESPQLCDENPFALGDQFLGWVHWQRCILRPDHQTRLTVISVRRSNIFRARWHIGFAVTVFSTNSSSEILRTFQCQGVYNPSRRFIEIASVPAEWSHLAIVGRFGRHDTYRLELQYILPASGDQCGSSVHTREN